MNKILDIHTSYSGAMISNRTLYHVSLYLVLYCIEKFKIH
jgi:hypothetical protein